ncbi:MAG: YhcN/YlaJ family sporulation lipoprotein [Clostridia bacterium]|nr:YhcN/YlaJ family sporulation lipoprotein [Clostridia bacterium]
MKKTLLTLALMAGALTLSSCAAKPDMTTATNPPAATQGTTTFPDMLPSATGVLPQVQDGMNEMLEGMTGSPTSTTSPTSTPEATGVTSMETARRVVEQIEDELERLSEVDDAEVVLAGNRAVVGLEFDDQYQGGIDERLRGIVRERIAGVISGVTDIVITADAAIMDEIETLGDRLKTMSDMSALQSDLDAIVRKIGGA